MIEEPVIKTSLLLTNCTETLFIRLHFGHYLLGLDLFALVKHCPDSRVKPAGPKVVFSFIIINIINIIPQQQTSGHSDNNHRERVHIQSLEHVSLLESSSE